MDYDFESSGGPGLFINLDGDRARVDLSHIAALGCGDILPRTTQRC